MGGKWHLEVAQRSPEVEEVGVLSCRLRVLNSFSPRRRQGLCPRDERTGRSQETLERFRGEMPGMEATLGASLRLLRKKKEELLLPFLLEQLSHLWLLNPFCFPSPFTGLALLPWFQPALHPEESCPLTSPDLLPRPLPGISSRTSRCPHP